MSNLTACVACNPEEITNNGSCQACPEGQVPNANQTVCEVPPTQPSPLSFKGLNNEFIRFFHRSQILNLQFFLTNISYNFC